MKKNLIICIFLMVGIQLPLHAEGGFWNRGLGKLLLRVDQWMEDGQRSGIDTLYQDVPKLNHQVYLGGYAYWQNYQMHLPIYMSSALREAFPKLPNWTHYDINAHTTQTELELGIDWKGLSIELPIPIRNNYNKSFGLAKNGSVWGFRIRYKEMKKMNGTRKFDADQHITDPGFPDGGVLDPEGWLSDQAIEPDQHTVRMFYAEGYYVLNHRKFSLGAGLYADMIQKRSAGSMMVYGNYFRSRYNAEDLLASNYDSFQTQQVSLGLGYGYNWVFNKGKIVLHASAVPMISLYAHQKHTASFNNVVDPETGMTDEQLYKSLYPANETDFYEAADRSTSRFHLNAFARLAANYSFDRYILTFLLNYRHYGYSNTNDLRIRNQEADAQINFCVRF